MPTYRLFVACSFREDRLDLRNYIAELVRSHGVFEPVFGSDISFVHGPAEKVRTQIATCNAAMIVETADREGSATPWVYSEIGMAYQERLPIFALVDRSIKDTGITKYCVSYATFDPAKFTESRAMILAGLLELETAVTELKDHARTPANVLRRDLAMMLPSMVLGLSIGKSLDARALTNLRTDLMRVIDESFAQREVFSESDGFSQKLVAARAAKQGIAVYVYNRFLKDLPQTGQEIVLDSGTVTFTICEKLVQESCQVPIITNNIAVGRHLSEIPRYPCFILPGKLESRYLASLGDETESYFLKMLTEHQVAYGIVAATSFTFEYGIAGNDPRHASFKKLMLENCPSTILVFEGEKIVQDIGIPICTTEEWKRMLKTKEIFIVTHRPEQWDTLGEAKKHLFERTVENLRTVLGEDRLVVLTP